ncbi:MAG: DUF350 domain-containing protein, partial [Bacteroidota bacterium]
MNTRLILFSLLELSISLLLAIFVLYLTFLVIDKLVMKRYQIQKDNIAYAILAAAILFSVGNIMEGTIDPITSTIRQLQGVHDHVYRSFQNVSDRKKKSRCQNSVSDIIFLDLIP